MSPGVAPVISLHAVLFHELDPGSSARMIGVFHFIQPKEGQCSSALVGAVGSDASSSRHYTLQREVVVPGSWTQHATR